MSNGFRGINARVGGNIINPLPYLQQSQQANPWYNPMMKGPDLVGGLSASLNKMKQQEELERKRGLEEREMVVKEKTGEAGVSQKEAMAGYYGALADATGQAPAGKTLNKKDQIMYDAVMSGPYSDEVKQKFKETFTLPTGEIYPEELLTPALLWLEKLTGNKIPASKVSSPVMQAKIIKRYLDAKETAEAGLSPDVISPESVEANRNAEIRNVNNLFESGEAGNILTGQYENIPQRIKAYAAATDVYLDRPHEYSVIKRLMRRNPDLVNNKQREYVKLVDSTSNAFFKMWDSYPEGNEGEPSFFDDFEDPKLHDLMFEADNIDDQALYWMYFIHSGKFAEASSKDEEKGGTLAKLLELLGNIPKSLDKYYAK